ncbi:MAG TPA: signal peptidase I [Eubacterium sp.]|nr:signal peptidase I [Eubacterium sp.]
MSEQKKKMIIKEVIGYGITILLACLCAYIITHFFIINAVVPTGSMDPTIKANDRLIGNRLAYRNSDPQRGDIVIFPFPDNESETFVKRIIGLPGETVEIHDGHVYINGAILDESAYLSVETKGTFGPYIVPFDSYFMLGDNRQNSKDSRAWDNKFVKRDKILAKAWFRYYKGFKKY